MEYVNNVLKYCDSYLKEYKLVIESHYKDLLDDLKNKNLVSKVFKLYNYETITPYCFMYDYGTWIFFTKFSAPKCIVKYNDATYNKDWANIHLDEYIRKTILKELNLRENDIIESVVVQGCKFLDTPARDDIDSNAIYHARSRVRLEASLYLHRKIPIKRFVENIMSKNNIFIMSLLILVFLLGFFFGNLERLRYTKKIKVLGFEIELSDKYFERNIKPQTSPALTK